MSDTRILAQQHIGKMGKGARATVVELNVYPHFQATPARLRRSFDALIADKIKGFVGRQFVFDALGEAAEDVAVKADLKELAGSFGSALETTFEELGNRLRGYFGGSGG